MNTLDKLLKKFTNPEHPVLKDVLLKYHYRGDGTESGARNIRAIIGDAAYENLNYDTFVSTGYIALWVPRYRHPEALENHQHRILTPAHHWALGEIDERSPEVMPASTETIGRVRDEFRAQLAELPGLEYVEVRNVTYFSHGDKVEKMSEPAPKDVVYFRFNGGFGIVVPRDYKAAAAKEES